MLSTVTILSLLLAVHRSAGQGSSNVTDSNVTVSDYLCSENATEHNCFAGFTGFMARQGTPGTPDCIEECVLLLKEGYECGTCGTIDDVAPPVECQSGICGDPDATIGDTTAFLDIPAEELPESMRAFTPTCFLVHLAMTSGLISNCTLADTYNDDVRTTCGCSNAPTPVPTTVPSLVPTTVPSLTPTTVPSLAPTSVPSVTPTTETLDDAETPAPTPSPTAECRSGICGDPDATIGDTAAFLDIPAEELPESMRAFTPTCFLVHLAMTSGLISNCTLADTYNDDVRTTCGCSNAPTPVPTTVPSLVPTTVPSLTPTTVPSLAPTSVPSVTPTTETLDDAETPAPTPSPTAECRSGICGDPDATIGDTAAFLDIPAEELPESMRAFTPTCFLVHLAMTSGLISNCTLADTYNDDVRTTCGCSNAPTPAPTPEGRRFLR